MSECNLRDGYACFGSTEIWNVCRTLNYVDALLPRNGFSIIVNKDSDANFCCGCCDLAYVSPELDEAPWYDPVAPESAGFFGIMPTAIDGLSINPTSRSISPGVLGGTIGRRFEASRNIAVTAIAYADSCDAMDYGLAWLQATLERDCGADGFNWQACCPSDSGSIVSEESGDPAASLRRIPCAALTSGIEAERFSPETTRGYMYEIDFTITAEQSWIYEPGITLLTETVRPGDGVAVVDYEPDCINGAAIEVFIDRAYNVGSATNIVMRANPTRSLPPSAALNVTNARYGAQLGARPGDSILIDPRCNLVSTVGPTGAILRPHNLVSLTHNSKGLFPIAYYGEEWRIQVNVPDNGSGPVSVTFRAHPRRRF